MKRKIKESLMIKAHDTSLNLDAGVYPLTQTGFPFLLALLLRLIHPHICFLIFNFLNLCSLLSPLSCYLHPSFPPDYYLISSDFQFESVPAEEGLKTETSIATFIFGSFCTTLMLMNKVRLLLLQCSNEAVLNYQRVVCVTIGVIGNAWSYFEYLPLSMCLLASSAHFQTRLDVHKRIRRKGSPPYLYHGICCDYCAGLHFPYLTSYPQSLLNAALCFHSSLPLTTCMVLEGKGEWK